VLIRCFRKFSIYCSVLQPGGSLFFTTINRTWPSYALAVVAAEYILGAVPRGTHDWNKFISPEDIERLLAPGSISSMLYEVASLLNIFKLYFYVRANAFDDLALM
jgi:2-polyprenyl-3-methyl-5-hydroxy-6-metoxy-1,4-benzoquinol methylase